MKWKVCAWYSKYTMQGQTKAARCRQLLSPQNNYVSESACRLFCLLDRDSWEALITNKVQLAAACFGAANGIKFMASYHSRWHRSCTCDWSVIHDERVHAIELTFAHPALIYWVIWMIIQASFFVRSSVWAWNPVYTEPSLNNFIKNMSYL